MTIQNSIQASNKVALEELFSRASELGAMEGGAARSRPDFAILACRAGAEGVISTAPEHKDNVKKLHMSYVKSVKDAADDSVTSEMASLDQQLSKLRACITLGALGGQNGHNYDGPAVLARARAVHVKNKKDLRGSTFDAMITIARKQKDVEYRGKEFDDADILYHLTPTGKIDKTELELAASILGSMQKMRDGNENSGRPGYPSEQLSGAINYMDALVDRLKFAAEKEKLLKLEQRITARHEASLVDAAEHERRETLRAVQGMQDVEEEAEAA